MEKKIMPYVCPKCGGENVECTDYEWDSESIRQQHTCHDCEAVWDEYHELTYRGYAYKGVDYDENGNEMEFNEVKPPSSPPCAPSSDAFLIIINH